MFNLFFGKGMLAEGTVVRKPIVPVLSESKSDCTRTDVCIMFITPSANIYFEDFFLQERMSCFHHFERLETFQDILAHKKLQNCQLLHCLD